MRIGEMGEYRANSSRESSSLAAASSSQRVVAGVAVLLDDDHPELPDDAQLPPQMDFAKRRQEEGWVITVVSAGFGAGAVALAQPGVHQTTTNSETNNTIMVVVDSATKALKSRNEPTIYDVIF